MKNALVMSNVQPDIRCKFIVFNPDGNHRPVANITDDGITQQCVVEGDIVFILTHTDVDSVMIHVNIHGQSTNEPFEKLEYYAERYLSESDHLFFMNNSRKLPPNDNWNGTDTIKGLVYKYGLHKFFVGAPDYTLLIGLMNLHSNPEIPSVGNFDVSGLLSKISIASKYKPVAEHNLKNILNNVDMNYRQWLINDGISSEYKQFNWRSAESMPNELSVSCIMNNGKPVRFNDLIVWRGNDEEPEVISVFDIANTFTMDKTNFLSMPYVIDEDVTRIMYIVHGSGKLCRDTNNIATLYRRR